MKNVFIVIQISLKLVPSDPINSTGSDNGLASNSQQAIVWTCDG